MWVTLNFLTKRLSRPRSRFPARKLWDTRCKCNQPWLRETESHQRMYSTSSFLFIVCFVVVMVFYLYLFSCFFLASFFFSFFFFIFFHPISSFPLLFFDLTCLFPPYSLFSLQHNDNHFWSDSSVCWFSSLQYHRGRLATCLLSFRRSRICEHAFRSRDRKIKRFVEEGRVGDRKGLE